MTELCDIRPQKKETHKTRLIAGRNIVDYPGEVRTPTSYLTTMKRHVNIAISEVKPIYMCIYVKAFFLNNQMDRA